MGQRSIKASELRDVNVKLISLVKRGANRLPIRVMKGDKAVLDLGSYFVRKDDSDDDMMKREKKMKSDLQAAIGLLQSNGFGVIKLETTKSEPADDGVGIDEGKNPAADSDAGGPRDDGTSGTSDDSKTGDNADADAGGLRDNGTDGAKAPLTQDYVPVNKAEMDAVAAALAAVRKTDKPVKKAGKKMKQAMPAPAALDTDVQCADASDDPNPNEMAGADGEDGEGSDPDAEDDSVQEVTHQKKDAKKTVAKTDAPDISAMIREAFEKQEASLTAMVKAQLAPVQTELKAVAQRVEKSEELVAGTAKRLSAIVPAQPAHEGSGAVRKTDNFLPPPLDTGYSR